MLGPRKHLDTLGAMDRRLVVPTWKRSPHFIESLPIDFPPETFDLRRIEGVLARMPQWIVLYRDGSNGPAGPMATLRDTDFSGCLERRLSAESIHINMVDAHRYDPLIADALDRFTDTLDPGMVRRGDVRRPTAALFLSSPRACTFYHFDREQNFLLQIRGRKTMFCVDGREALVTELAKACLTNGRRINQQYRPELRRSARAFHLTPGTTLYNPRLWRHWVENGDEISVSLSLNFFTPPDRRREWVYAAGEWARALPERVARRIHPRGLSGRRPSHGP